MQTGEQHEYTCEHYYKVLLRTGPGGLSLCCLMAHGFSKDIRCPIELHSFVCLQVTRTDIRPQVKYDVSLVIADSRLVFSRGLCEYVGIDRKHLIDIHLYKFFTCLGVNKICLNQ